MSISEYGNSTHSKSELEKILIIDLSCRNDAYKISWIYLLNDAVLNPTIKYLSVWQLKVFTKPP